MKIIQIILDYLYRKLYKFKGGRVVKLTSEQDENLEVLTVSTILGYEVTIYCKEYNYAIKYNRCLFPSRDYTVYKMFAKMHGDPPEDIRRTFEEVIYLPPLPPKYVSYRLRRRLLVGAYIDLLAVKLH